MKNVTGTGSVRPFSGVIYFLLCSALAQFAAWVRRYTHPEAIAARQLRREINRDMATEKKRKSGQIRIARP